MKRLYHPANHMLANGSQLSQQHFKTYCPNRQCGGLAVLVLHYVSILLHSILNVPFERDLSVYTRFISKAYHPSTPSSEMKSLIGEGLWYTYLHLFSFTKTISFVKCNLSNGFQKNFKICKILLTMYENLKIFKLFLL